MLPIEVPGKKPISVNVQGIPRSSSENNVVAFLEDQKWTDVTISTCRPMLTFCCNISIHVKTVGYYYDYNVIFSDFKKSTGIYTGNLKG